MSRSLERLLKLARRTGDRLIVHDPAAEEDIVIMSVGQYEGLLDAKEDLEEYMDEFESFRGQIAQKKDKHVEETMPEPEEIVYEAPVMNTPPLEPLNTPMVQEAPEEPSPFPLDEEKEVSVTPQPELIATPEPLYHPIGEQQQRPVGSNWTPAIALLEEKFRVLTKQSGGEAVPLVTPIGEPEPRQVPMVAHEEEMDTFEDDDEPIFFEEPV